MATPEKRPQGNIGYFSEGLNHRAVYDDARYTSLLPTDPDPEVIARATEQSYVLSRLGYDQPVIGAVTIYEAPLDTYYGGPIYKQAHIRSHEVNPALLHSSYLSDIQFLANDPLMREIRGCEDPKPNPELNLTPNSESDPNSDISFSRAAMDLYDAGLLPPGWLIEYKVPTGNRLSVISDARELLSRGVRLEHKFIKSDQVEDPPELYN